MFVSFDGLKSSENFSFWSTTGFLAVTEVTHGLHVAENTKGDDPWKCDVQMRW